MWGTMIHSLIITLYDLGYTLALISVLTSKWIWKTSDTCAAVFIVILGIPIAYEIVKIAVLCVAKLRKNCSAPESLVEEENLPNP